MADKNIELQMRWDHGETPAGKPVQRGLLLELTTPTRPADASEPRRPLNLALVVDRSGSMQGGRLAAARMAATGISRHLTPQDRLSAVAYDTDLQVLLDGVPQDAAGKAAAEAAVAKLQPGGCTDLGGGWMTGARCVSAVMEREGLNSGHVLLLSDGHANHGVTDPGELARHAGELAARGVTSSCVGIGDGYSALQLDAIAEAGRGQLHHSNDPEQIVDVVLGELGELLQVAAHQARLKLTLPPGLRAQQLTRFAGGQGAAGIELDLGDIPSGRTRRIAFLIEGAPQTVSDAITCRAELSWQDDQGHRVERACETSLRVVSADDFDAAGKDVEVARAIAELWLARTGYEAMVLNERGLYQEAVEAFALSEAPFEELIAELAESERRRFRDRRDRTRHAVSDEWSGEAKLSSFSLVKKAMRSERDYSGGNPDDWTDRA